ncbi:hypothetical protein [Chryseobacterium sp.]
MNQTATNGITWKLPKRTYFLATNAQIFIIIAFTIIFYVSMWF